MRVIKQGIAPKDIEQEKTCIRCQTVIGFTNKDIKRDQRDGDYIVCPTCGTFINAKAATGLEVRLGIK
jgi:DNA-directed RNA polymerase subunit RPC12/RpoP